MGLVQNSGEQIYRAHRELYKLGRNALPAIEEQILGQSWRDIRHGSQLNLLSGLLSLVNDIDEDRAKRVGEEIRKTGCSSIVKKRITSITTFALNEFRAYEIEGTRIFQSRALGNSPHIKSYMEKWLAIVPKKDMAQIERIYIIPETTEEHRGTYMPILCNMMIEWDLPVSYYNPLSWIFLTQIEKTLYHEIGHHVHGHTFGQDSDRRKKQIIMPQYYLVRVIPFSRSSSGRYGGFSRTGGKWTAAPNQSLEPTRDCMSIKSERLGRAAQLRH